MKATALAFCILFVALSTVSADRYQSEPSSFDFIVCGVGTAGGAVAARLSENPKWTVLALDKGPKAQQPFAPGFNFLPKNFNFVNVHDPGYLSMPQPGMNNRMLYSPRYEGFGGTSQIYGASARRPSPTILNSWPAGWQFQDLLPYFKKMEDHYCYYDSSNITGITPDQCRAWHGKGGPVQINGPVIEAFEDFTWDYLNTLVNDSFFDGYSPDQNGDPAQRSGVALWQKFRYRQNRNDRLSPQTRVSSESAYLTPAVQQRPNLFLKSGCPVLKIIFDSSKTVAVGVEYFDLTTNRVVTAFAKKEVIIAGGAFGTPQLLQVSGIGDKNVLDPLGIEVIAHNPHVGKHLWEHFSARLLFNTSVRFPFTSQADFDKFGHTNPTLELVNGAYPVSAHLASGFNAPGITDMQIYLWEGQYALYDIQPIMGNPSSIFSGIPGASFLLVNLFPESNEGSVTITSPSIFHKPLIDYNITKLTDTDRAVMKKLLTKMIDILTNTPFGQKYNLGIVSPAPDQDLDEYIDKDLGVGWHPACTCRLGDCTDADLIVRGTANVRVVDASAFATQIDANTVYLTFAMAEKLSDMIKHDWSRKE
jgi:choline dehydrogenase